MLVRSSAVMDRNTRNVVVTKPTTRSPHSVTEVLFINDAVTKSTTLLRFFAVARSWCPVTEERTRCAVERRAMTSK